MPEGQYGDEVICPYCYHKHSDSWEMGGGDEGGWDQLCYECGKEFRASRIVDVQYRTHPTPEGTNT